MAQTYADSFNKLVSDISEKLEPEPQFGHAMRKHFQFDAKWTNLNQGSYGSHPLAVRDALRAFQSASEFRPDEFTRTTFPVLLDKSRAALAAHLHAPLSEIVIVQNATTGVGTVLRALQFERGDKIVFFNFIYEACRNAVQYMSETTQVVGVEISVVFPLSDDEIVGRLRDTIRREQDQGACVRIAIFDTIISMPGLRLPFERMVAVCKELGVLSLVDGAHGIGHIPLDLGALDADFFVSNCHKWLYVPRGCAVFHVPLRNQHLIRSTLPTSQGFIARGTTPRAPAPPGAKSDFITMFEFVGTVDASPALCVPAALRFREHVCGGEERIMAYCQGLALAGAQLLAARLETEVLARENGVCCLYNVRLPIAPVAVAATEEGARVRVWLMDGFQARYDAALPVVFYNGCWWARVSGQVYLELSDFEFAARMVAEMCARVERKEHLVVG